ncbi:MAG TPA: MBL fold metallo-hydrolase [Saprospiraceae bacterium]|nr:MBL fold metallo-hydrolase [Saprospiraceae bacterium]
MTRLFSVKAGTFKLDGGAMFGVVPKTLWARLNPPDENNLCTWALRCLLMDTGERRILIDTGMGTKQDAKFFSHYEPSGHILHESLSQLGFDRKDITDVFLTHLHFDHCGGALEKNAVGSIVPAFPNATYWSCKSHLEWALTPNARERASFLRENIMPFIEQDLFQFIPEEQDIEWIEGIRILFAYGHTQAMMIPKIPFRDSTVVFCADLLPSSYHVSMPYVMSYDTRPLLTLEEKERFFVEVIEGNFVLFLEHDPVNECIRLTKDERGRYVISEYLSLQGLNDEKEL